MCCRKLRVVLFFAIKSAHVVHLKYRGPRNINFLCSKWPDSACLWRVSWVILSNQNTRLVLQQCLNYLQNKLHFFVGCFTVALQSIPIFANVILVSIDFHVKFDDFFYVCLVSFLFRWFVSARGKLRQRTTKTVCCKFLRELFFVSVDSRSHVMSKMGASGGLKGRTKVLSDDKFRALNKALKIDKKKPQGMTINMPMKNIVSVLQRCFILQRYG